MKQCDIVVSATSAPHVVVKQEYYTPEKQVTFLDLATPRDIDPKLSDDAKVNLINLDTIKEISKANQSEREELCRQSNTMISKAKEENDAVAVSGTNGRNNSLLAGKMYRDRGR